MRLYIQHGPKLIYNQLGCLYRHFGANSDEAVCFLICTSLISQHMYPMMTLRNNEQTMKMLRRSLLLRILLEHSNTGP
ncbi:unnamed protein product [Penicillium salamii]|nr:unnamed protein product [Penicillium salamii]